MFAQQHALFRFDALLDELRPVARRGAWARCRFGGSPAVKDPIESLGIPHVEVGRITVDGREVGFGHRLQGGERVVVEADHPGLQPSIVLRAALPAPGFLLDVHLGCLARRLRMVGLDTAYDNNATDRSLVDQSLREHRRLLTRDRKLLCIARLDHGYWVRSTDCNQQLAEVVARFGLDRRLTPFTRCIACNGLLETCPTASVADRVPADVRARHARISRCTACGRCYWPGSHFDRMRALLDRLELG